MLENISKEVMDAIIAIIMKIELSENDEEVHRALFKYVTNDVFRVSYDMKDGYWTLWTENKEPLARVYGGEKSYQKAMVLFSTYLEMR